MAGQERSIDSMMGMVIAILAIVYTIAVNVFELFRKKKEPPPSLPPISSNRDRDSEDPLQDFFESLKKIEQQEEEEEELEEETIEEEVPSLMTTSTKQQEIGTHERPGNWRTPEEKFILRSTIEDLQQQTKIEGRALQIGLHRPEDLVSNAITKPVTAAPKLQSMKKGKKSPIQDFLRQLPNKKALIIASEIIRPPVGFRNR